MEYHTLSAADKRATIAQHVSQCYWQEDVNCATTMLKTLAQIYGVPLQPQLIAAAVGMHGAGCYGAQCGLVEGMLLFLGVLAGERGESGTTAVSACHCFAAEFSQEFGSLLCRQLRPQGFRSDDPPHLCEALTCRAIEFAAAFIKAREQDYTVI